MDRAQGIRRDDTGRRCEKLAAAAGSVTRRRSGKNPVLRPAAIALALLALPFGPMARPQPAASAVPDLTGIYMNRRCLTQTDVCPEMNLAGAELAAPKYDCWPATLPILFGDPYSWQIEQLADRVILTYEKDDVVRTVWLEGHGHTAPNPWDFFIHGYSTGRYEGGRLVVETSHFLFDPSGIASDNLNAPSSTQKFITERYWREGRNLRMALTVEDPIFLRAPIEYRMEWSATDEPLSLPWNCDPAAAQRNLKVVPTKSPAHPPVVRRN
jgi:hypothetical protein